MKPEVVEPGLPKYEPPMAFSSVEPGAKQPAPPRPYNPPMRLANVEPVGEPPPILSSVVLRNWLGMVSNASPHRLGDSHVQVQENMASIVAGECMGRSGMRAVSFEN